VKTVAMQSTGVYWISLYEVLEERGFEVYLVNASHTKDLPRRKGDVQESQWLLKLRTYGLLNNSFQPPAEIRVPPRIGGNVQNTCAEQRRVCNVSKKR
jgi:transposase